MFSEKNFMKTKLVSKPIIQSSSILKVLYIQAMCKLSHYERNGEIRSTGIDGCLTKGSMSLSVRMDVTLQ